MTNQQAEDITAMVQEVRRLLLERAQKKRELDAIDHAIAAVVGVEEDRPSRQRLSKKDLRNLCRARVYERVPEKKRPAVDSGMV